MYIIIIGCGRVGCMLAGNLSREGHQVVVIDRDKRRFDNLDSNFGGTTKTGDGVDIDLLREAGIENAAVIVAATGDDNANLMSAQIARKMFNIRRVLVRIKNPRKLEVYKEYDLEAVSATTLAGERLMEMIRVPRLVNVLGTLEEDRIKIVEFPLGSLPACKKLQKLIAGKKFSVFGIGEQDKLEFSDLNRELSPGMRILGSISIDQLKHLIKIFESDVSKELRK